MKIFIDSTLFIVYEWKDGKRSTVLLNYFGQYNALSFQTFVNKILSPCQLQEYVGGDYDQVYVLSKKREKIMYDQIEMMKNK